MLTRLKKYLNPHENSCSKVISKLTTGNILQESSSAPQQHKSVQYKWFTLYLRRDVSYTDILQPILSAAEGFRGQEATCADPGFFFQFYLDLSIFLSYQRGSNGFIAEKTILILYQGSRGVHYFPGGGGGGVKLFPGWGGGPNANFFRNPYTYFFPGGDLGGGICQD